MTYPKIPFPTIDVTKPYGSYRVSTVDDHERETRRWLRQSLQAISGYPEVDTIGLKGWTDSTRPQRSVNGNYLLGYNTSKQMLEIVDEDGNLKNAFRAFCLEAHPVGSIYETTDVNFNPMVAWGGVWEKWEDGRFLLSTYQGKYAVGQTGGEEQHLLVMGEMPIHTHEFQHQHPHYHTRGTMNITGEFGVDDQMTHYYNGAFYAHKYLGGSPNTTSEGGDDDGFAIQFDASKSWEGHTSLDETYNTGGPREMGGGLAHNNMPPYRVVIRWHRIA